MIYVTALVDNINSGVNDIEDGLEQGANLLREAASHRLESLKDVSISMGNSVKKSIMGYSKEAGRLARSFSDFVDVEDVFKSIDKRSNPEKYDQRQPASIVHTPIDWTKTPPITCRKFTQDLLRVIEEDCEEENSQDEKTLYSHSDENKMYGTKANDPINAQVHKANIEVPNSSNVFIKQKGIQDKQKEITQTLLRCSKTKNIHQGIPKRKTYTKGIRVDSPRPQRRQLRGAACGLENNVPDETINKIDLRNVQMKLRRGIHIEEQLKHNKRTNNTTEYIAMDKNKQFFPEDEWSPRTVRRKQCSFNKNNSQDPVHTQKGSSFPTGSPSSKIMQRSFSIPFEQKPKSKSNRTTRTNSIPLNTTYAKIRM